MTVEKFREIISDVVRIGQVSSVDQNGCTCRVSFDDMLQADGTAMVSYPLHIIQPRTVDAQVYCMPNVGEHVLCLFMPNAPEYGFVIGSFYTSNNLPENGGSGIYRSHYIDETIIEYDLNKHTARIFAPNGYVDVEKCIDADLYATRNITAWADGEMDIHSKGKMKISSDTHLELKAPRIDLN